MEYEDNHPGHEEAELLGELIRNKCVNTGSVDSGQERRNAELLADYLGGSPGLDTSIIEAAPGRASLVARWEGSAPGPTLAFLTHTDVVPADASEWSFDPYGGDLVDGSVRGRGAVDMLNLASSMAASVRRLGETGFHPEGTLLFLAVADEEAGGRYGTGYLTEKFPDLVRADYVITEWGGIRYDLGGVPGYLMVTGEKGVAWIRVKITGKSAHGSRPYGAQNPILAASRLVSRIEQDGAPVHITEAWERFVRALGLPPGVHDALLDANRVDEALETLPMPMGAFAHACTRMTVSPTVVTAGTKVNVIPRGAELQLDVRTLPGQSTEDAVGVVVQAAAAAGVDVDVEVLNESTANASSLEQPLWQAVATAVDALAPGARPIPAITTGGNDARFFRAMGATAYGGGMLSPKIDFSRFIDMFHGADEQIDLESLALSTRFFEIVARELLG